MALSLSVLIDRQISNNAKLTGRVHDKTDSRNQTGNKFPNTLQPSP